MVKAFAKATTFRIDPAVKDGLEHLSILLHQPQNQLVNTALKEFVIKRTEAMAADLDITLAKLKTYQKNDPDFEHAISTLAHAEAVSSHDPAEGRIVKLGDKDKKAKSTVRAILNE